jgi:hypothetical protein
VQHPAQKIVDSGHRDSLILVDDTCDEERTRQERGRVDSNADGSRNPTSLDRRRRRSGNDRCLLRVRLHAAIQGLEIATWPIDRIAGTSPLESAQPPVRSGARSAPRSRRRPRRSAGRPRHAAPPLARPRTIEVGQKAPPRQHGIRDSANDNHRARGAHPGARRSMPAVRPAVSRRFDASPGPHWCRRIRRSW